MKFKASILLMLLSCVILLCSFAFSNRSYVIDKEDIAKKAGSVEDAKHTNVLVAKKVPLKEMKSFKFDTVDLNGKKVTSDILKDAKVTMVNIWATWCPPCRAELPDIGRLAKKYKARGCQVIAICSDVTHEDTSALEDAKDIMESAKCEEVIVLRNNKSLDYIYEQIRAFPTTFFLNAKGDVIAPILVGGRRESDFAKVFDECLKKVK